jgi:hypothetical protein
MVHDAPVGIIIQKMAENLNFERLILRCPDEESSIDFLRTHLILHEQRFCCGMAMRRSYKTVRENQVEVWRCVEKACKKTKGVRPDTWIHPSTLPFTKIVRFIYCWAHEMTSVKFCERELEIDDNTTIDWSKNLIKAKTLLRNHFTQNPTSYSDSPRKTTLRGTF